MYTIQNDSRIEYIIERSRFICSLKKVADELEAQAFIKQIKKEYWDATHNCSAYLIDDLHQRSNDDGEPSGTAGLPMLEVLRKNNLNRVAVVVTRYFGGVKLGAGGLVRAYTNSVVLAIEKAGLVELILMGTFVLNTDTGESGKILNILYRQTLFSVIGVEYGAKTQILLSMRDTDRQLAEQWLTETLNQEICLEKINDDYLEVPVKNTKK